MVIVLVLTDIKHIKYLGFRKFKIDVCVCIQYLLMLAGEKGEREGGTDGEFR